MRPKLRLLLLPCCTKVRAFNLLLIFGVVNVLLFRNYFNSKVQTLWAPSSGSDNVPPHWLYNPTPYESPTFPSSGSRNRSDLDLNVTGVKGSSSSSSSSDVTLAITKVVTTTEDPDTLRAFGMEVRPRANVTAPWDPDNTSEPCLVVPPKLVGRLATYKTAPNMTEIEDLNPGLEPGGHFHPAECRARSRVVVIVPYRDREEHLRIMLHNLHPILIRQQLDYFVLVVELEQPTHFNRGMLLNIGAVEALGLWDVECFVFHDVDLVPENDRNLYTCPEMPRHMSVAVDKFGYKLPYQWIMGGVVAMRREHFYKLNGYSNLYFGWGGEDDDLAGRVSGTGLKITRYAMDIARYKMIKHQRDKKNEPNPQRFALLKSWKERHQTDGLNSLQYEVKKVEFRPAYTWMLVSIDMSVMMPGTKPQNKTAT